MTSELKTCRDITAAVLGREVSARSVVDAALARACKLQDEWHCFITITPELACRQAMQVDQKISSGFKLPLAGVPFAVKDNLDIAGVPTTYGSKMFKNRVAESNSTVVDRLLAAGAIPLGKLNLHECAFGFTGENSTFGNCKNPWNPNRISGGSSSGSALAVSLGICPFTIGTDTGGSIRLPSALCSVTGLKPTYGRVSRSGGLPLAWSMDHVGPICRTADDAAMVMQSIAGHDPKDDSTSRLKVPDYLAELNATIGGLRIGVPRAWFFDCIDRQVATSIESGIEVLVQLGARRLDIDLPLLDEAVGAHRAIIFSEASAFHAAFLRDNAELYGDDIRPALQAGLFIPAVDYLHAQRIRRVVRSAWVAIFKQVDVLVTPVTPVTAPKFGVESVQVDQRDRPLVRAMLDMTLPFCLTGHPAMTVPSGFSDDQMPIGMQLIGRPFEEDLLLRVAHRYQQATEWHRKSPPGFISQMN